MSWLNFLKELLVWKTYFEVRCSNSERLNNFQRKTWFSLTKDLIFFNERLYSNSERLVKNLETLLFLQKKIWFQFWKTYWLDERLVKTFFFFFKVRIESNSERLDERLVKNLGKLLFLQKRLDSNSERHNDLMKDWSKTFFLLQWKTWFFFWKTFFNERLDDSMKDFFSFNERFDSNLDDLINNLLQRIFKNAERLFFSSTKDLYWTYFLKGLF